MKPPIVPSPILALLVFLLACGLLLPFPVLADWGDARQWNVTADKMTRVEDPPTLVAEGNVLLEKKEPTGPPPKTSASRSSQPPETGEVPEGEVNLKTVTTIRADWVSYDVTQGIMQLKGHVLIDIGPDHLSAESGRLDLNTSTGTFDQATVLRREMEVHLEGEVVEKTGSLTYHIKDGWVITCKLEPGQTPPWSFAAADVEITDGGYAYLKHATFRILDVPVLYTPVMLLPAKRKRQTGFLFPVYGQSNRDGFSLETPFFINLSESADLTIYPHYYFKRGLMLGTEYRYVLDEESKGMVMGNYLDDKLSDPSETNYYSDGKFTHTNKERYWLRGKIDHSAGKWVSRVDIDIASDLDYLREFDNGYTGYTASDDRFSKVFNRGLISDSNQFRENTLAALRSWDNGTSLLGEIMAVNDISEQVYTADNPSRAWQLPSITYSGARPVYSNGPSFTWDANYTDFWRDKGVGAQRLDLVPTITTSIPLSPYLETSMGGGIRSTSYFIQDNGASDWQDTDSRNRFLYNLGGEIGTTLRADYPIDLEKVTSWSHTLRPYVAYGYTEIPEIENLPLFDPIDALKNQNTIYYGANNFFSIAGAGKGNEFEREYAFVKVKQGYDLRSEESDTPLTPVDMETGFYPLRRTRLLYNTKIDVYGDGIFYHSVSADYASSRGDRFSLDYRFNEQTSTNSISGTLWYLLPYNFATGYSIERAIEQNETLKEKIRLRYTQPCWAVELATEETPGNRAFYLVFSLANIGAPFGLSLSNN